MTLQRLTLRLRVVPGLPALFAFWYYVGQRAFVRLAFRAGRGVVLAAYLRRGGGRGELLPGASDLDFFLVLRALPAEREMEFLKRFWRSYFRWRRLFPFFGEVLMGEESELRQWLESPSVRSQEARFAWRRLAGSEARVGLAAPCEPEARDVYSEALKCYGALLQPVLKLRHLPDQLGAGSREAVPLRHAAKAAIDLFRLHYALSLPPAARAPVWRATRAELLTLLPAGVYGTEVARLGGLLQLRAPLAPGGDAGGLFSALLLRASRCLSELASGLETQPAGEADWRVLPEVPSPLADRYSLSVRELFAERVLLRHRFLTRAVLSDSSAHMYFLFDTEPTPAAFRELLLDLRDVSFSFDRFSSAMPLSEGAFRELERTPLFDSPFHAFSRQREARILPDGAPSTGPYRPDAARLSERMLAKTFAELSFGLRLPPIALDDFLERMVGLVLGLRVASDAHEVAPGFRAALTRFSERFPDRGAVLEKRLAPFVTGTAGAEQEFWHDTFRRLGTLSPEAARSLRGQLEDLRAQNRRLAVSSTKATDLWINLTPFLRMEMGALKEKYFRHRGPMKV